MTERPVLFSGPLVRAILEGRKSQTRRPVKPAVREKVNGEYEWRGEIFADGVSVVFEMPERCPLARRGDRLWVRETWQPSLMGSVAVVSYPTNVSGEPCGDVKWLDGEAHEKAIEMACGRKTKGWLPSIHMPRWASRLTLEVTDVRVQRVSDITEQDAMEEGIEPCLWPENEAALDRRPEVAHYQRGLWSEHRAGFARVWDAIYGKGLPWSSNPWCWAVTFRRVA